MEDNGDKRVFAVLAGDLAEKLRGVAEAENRSLNNTVETLLLAALKARDPSDDPGQGHGKATS